jgi:hypothetical protein
MVVAHAKDDVGARIGLRESRSCGDGAGEPGCLSEETAAGDLLAHFSELRFAGSLAE